MVVGIICEYNPLHLGHKKQMDTIRASFGPDTAIVCAMSGNFVQRGAPAIIDKSRRAQAAILTGADLVVELPISTALSSAEGFAAGGVRVLSSLCDVLCFGAETADASRLMATARALLSEDFPPLLREKLDTGLSFPAARQAALEDLTGDASLLRQPNDILAVEYCKAILSQRSKMDIFPILRKGSYHAEIADAENPSATAVRNLMLLSENWKNCIPKQALPCFENAALHTTESGERAILAKLRTMTDEEFESLPYGSEGLWRKLMHASRRESSLDAILEATKSKRYTRTRLQRMVLCAFLGITQSDLETEIPYCRILAFNDTGRTLLSNVKKGGFYRNAGEVIARPYQTMERRCGDLYGLFATEEPEAPGAEERRRVVYMK